VADVERFAGVDVGGPRKGFDVAILEGSAVVELRSGRQVGEVVEAIAESGAVVVGIDSPCCCAEPGEKSRAGERRLAREICPIFYTPDEETVRSGNPFYRWVVEGLELYAALARDAPGSEAIEVFPSAAWTVWAGPRDGRPKAQWSRQALQASGVCGLPRRTSQDARDAVGAALVASAYRRGGTSDFGGIMVPRPGAVALRR
jgi:predicted nuclease with RNAse H fold